MKGTLCTYRCKASVPLLRHRSAHVSLKVGFEKPRSGVTRIALVHFTTSDCKKTRFYYLVKQG